MKKTILFAQIVLTVSSYSKVFSQNKNALGAHFELGYSNEVTNKGSKKPDLSFLRHQPMH